MPSPAYFSRLLVPLLFFLSAALPASALDLHPEGQTFSAEGELSISIVETPGTHLTEAIIYQLALSVVETVELEIDADLVHDLKTGDRVRVEGIWIRSSPDAERLRVTHLEKIARDEAISSQSVSIQAAPRKVIAIAVDFSNATVSCTDQSMRDQMWSGSRNIRGLYETSSFSQASFTSDLDSNSQVDFFRVTIPSSTTSSCAYSTWITQANAALVAQGVNLSLWQHRAYFSPDDNCGFAGIANVGCGTSCYALSVACTLPDIMAHELGHNVGFGHASLDNNNDGTPDDSYGDISSPMGFGGVGWRQFNSANKLFQSWIPSDRIQDVSSTASMQLYSLDLDPLSASPAPASSTQLVRVPIANSPTNVGTQYLVSFRTADPTYSLNLQTASRNKIQIHRSYTTYITNNSSMLIRTLSAGQTFTDSAGVTINFVGFSGNLADVTVSVPGGAPPPTATSTPVPGATSVPTAAPSPTPTSIPPAAPTAIPTVAPTIAPPGSQPPQATPTARPKHAIGGKTVLNNGKKVSKNILSALMVVAIPSNSSASTAQSAVDASAKFQLQLQAGDYLLKVVSKSGRKLPYKIRSQNLKLRVPTENATSVQLRFSLVAAAKR